MAVNANNLGSGRIQAIFEDRMNNPAFGQALSHHPYFEYPEKADALTIKLEIVPQQHLLKSSQEKSSLTPLGANFPRVDLDTAVREGQVQQFGLATGYPQNMSGEKLYQRVKNVLAPMLYNKVLSDQDLILETMFKGTGSAAQARDTSTVDLTGQEFDDTASSPLDVFRDAAHDLAGGETILFLSHDCVTPLLSHPEIVQSIIKADVSRGQVDQVSLVTYLKQRFGLLDVLIGAQMQQQGSQYQSLSKVPLISGAACMFNKGSIVSIPFITNVGGNEWLDNASNTYMLSYSDWRCLANTDASQAVSFTNALT